MPQRTKKEKVAAKQKQALKYTIIENASPVKPTRVTETVVKHHEKHVLTHEEIETKNYFFQDLKKSIVFIIAILGLELFLHFARISTYFSK